MITERGFINKHNLQSLPSGMLLHDFTPVSVIQPNSTSLATLGVSFNDSTQPASFNIDFIKNDETLSCLVCIKAPIGEILRSIILPETVFISEKEKLKGMNEHSVKLNFSGNRKTLSQKIFEAANLAVISSEDDIIR